jgi:hypothetical protein
MTRRAGISSGLVPEKSLKSLLGTIEVTKSLLKSWMQPIEASVPKFLAESGHKAIVYREPHGVTLIMGPFNGPLLCLLRPVITALRLKTHAFKISDAQTLVSATLGHPSFRQHACKRNQGVFIRDTELTLLLNQSSSVYNFSSGFVSLCAMKMRYRDGWCRHEYY